jgi:hypothetical protein
MRFVSAAHDLALALLVGGLAGVFVSVGTLFARAPTREIAGQVGNAIFGRLAPAAVLLAAIVLGARLRLHRGEPASARRSLALVLAAAIALTVAAAALYLTPRMSAIWTAAPHAADGSGLAGEDKVHFLRLHILSNLSYLAALLAGIALILAGAIVPSPRGPRR